MSCPGILITIDGNIGSGKTTQLELLGGKYEIFREPIESWPLESFYDNKSRWAFLLQMTILKTFQPPPCKNAIYERSPDSSKNVFWSMMCDDGIVTEDEKTTCNYFYSVYGWTPDIVIYIRTSPEKCYERLTKRHQKGDTGVSLEYLQKVHSYYEQFIACTCESPNIHIIDGNTDDRESIHKQILKIIEG